MWSSCVSMENRISLCHILTLPSKTQNPFGRGKINKVFCNLRRLSEGKNTFGDPRKMKQKGKKTRCDDLHKQKCGRKMSRMLSSEKAGGGAKNELSNCSSLLWNRDPITGHSVLIIIIFIQAFYLFSSFDRDLLYSFFLRFKSFIPALCLSFPSCSRNFSGGKKKKNWGPMHSALKNSSVTRCTMILLFVVQGTV